MEFNSDDYNALYRQFKELCRLNIAMMDTYRLAMLALERDGGVEADIIHNELVSLLRSKTPAELTELKRALSQRYGQYH